MINPPGGNFLRPKISMHASDSLNFSSFLVELVNSPEGIHITWSSDHVVLTSQSSLKAVS